MGTLIPQPSAFLNTHGWRERKNVLMTVRVMKTLLMMILLLMTMKRRRKKKKKRRKQG